jgi:N-acetylmuramoyl-L-alanine amidase
MKHYKVAIDIGHARGTGATGNGLQEHEVCAKLAGYVKDMLANAANIHADIIDFPELSNRADLNASIAAVNAGGYDAVVSLHCDCSDNADARGAHVIHRSLLGHSLAIEIAERLALHLPGRAQLVVQRKDLAILNQTRPTAVLVECGFLSNAHDAMVLKSRPIMLARAIAGGIQQWVQGMSQTS